MKTEDLSILKINKLTQEQYNRALQEGKLNSNEIYLTPDEPIDLSPYATTSDLETAVSGLNSEISKKQATINGAATTITSKDLTKDRVLISNNSGKVAVSDITTTELGYLDGVTSNIQTQLNNKLSTTGTAANASKLGNIAAADYATTSAVDEKFASLDGAVTGTGNFVKTISQTDGKITATLGDITMDDIPSHASSSDKYGPGSDEEYGHLMLSDEFDSPNGVKDGIAATPAAVKAAYELASTAKSAADDAKNQNAISSIIVGNNEYNAPNITSSLELIGSNVSINATGSGKTGDITITLGVANGSTSAKGLLQLTDGVESTSTKTAATPNAVKTAYDKASTAESAASNAQAKADSAYNLAGTKLDADAKAVGALDSDKLGDKEPSYYATSDGLSEVSQVASTANEQASTNASAITSLQAQIDTLNAKTNTDNGDAGKSIRKIANEELAAQLIPNEAKESLNTLKEIADWIQKHPDDVTEINSDILALIKEVYGSSATDIPSDGKSRLDSIDTSISNINSALSEKQATINGAASTVTADNLTKNSVLVSDSNGKIAASSTITTTELGYLDGVTSNINTQFQNIATTYATKTELSTETSARENTNTALGNRISTLETAVGSGGSVETKIANALKDAKDYSDQSETDAISSAKTYTNERETAITQAYTAKINPIELKTTHTNIAYGTCSTAAATAEKAINIQTEATTVPWALKKGAIIIATFVNTNTAKNPKFKVGTTDAKPVYYEGAAIAESNLSYAGYKNRAMIFVYDGTGYRFAGWGFDGNTNTYLRTYLRGDSDYNKDYPLLASQTVKSSIGTEEDKYRSVYGLVPTSDNYAPTINPYTGLIKAYKLSLSDTLNVTAKTTLNTLDVGGVTTYTGGHIYLTGADAGSSTANTTQLVFGTAQDNHVVLSSNSRTLVINPTTSSASDQIVFYLDKESTFPKGIKANITGDLTGTASKATADASGNTITSTYETKSDASGKLDAAKAYTDDKVSKKQDTITGAATTITGLDLTASRALISNSSGKVAVSAVTSTELGYLDGVTSAIQTQLNGKLSTGGGTISGNLTVTGKTTTATAEVTTGFTSSGSATFNGTAVFNKDHGVQIGNGVKLTYNETKQCLNFTFV